MLCSNPVLISILHNTDPFQLLPINISLFPFLGADGPSETLDLEDTTNLRYQSSQNHPPPKAQMCSWNIAQGIDHAHPWSPRQFRGSGTGRGAVCVVVVGFFFSVKGGWFPMGKPTDIRIEIEVCQPCLNRLWRDLYIGCFNHECFWR